MVIDVVKELLKASDALSDIIISQTPGQSGVTKADFDELVSKRDRITMALNNLIGQGFKPACDLDAACEELKKANKALEEAAKTVEAIKTGINVAGQVLAAAAKVVVFFV